VVRRQVSKRPQLNNAGRFLLVWLYRWFPSVLNAIAILRPETIIRWASGKLNFAIVSSKSLQKAAH
jgi:hypothetical protein